MAAAAAAVPLTAVAFTAELVELEALLTIAVELAAALATRAVELAAEFTSGVELAEEASATAVEFAAEAARVEFEAFPAATLLFWFCSCFFLSSSAFFPLRPFFPLPLTSFLLFLLLLLLLLRSVQIEAESILSQSQGASVKEKIYPFPDEHWHFDCSQRCHFH